MKRFLFVLVLFALLVACRDPRQTRLPENLDQWETDQDFQEAVQELTLEEQNILKTYLIRVTMAELSGEPVPKGLTILEAINAQETHIEQWHQKEAVRKAEERARYKFKNDYMENQLQLVDFEVREKLLASGNGIRRILSGALVNEGEKPLRDVQITVAFRDMKGFTIGEKTYSPIATLNSLQQEGEPFVFAPKQKIRFNYPVVEEVSPDWGGIATAMVTDIVFYDAPQAVVR